MKTTLSAIASTAVLVMIMAAGTASLSPAQESLAEPGSESPISLPESPLEAEPNPPSHEQEIQAQQAQTDASLPDIGQESHAMTGHGLPTPVRDPQTPAKDEDEAGSFEESAVPQAFTGFMVSGEVLKIDGELYVVRDDRGGADQQIRVTSETVMEGGFQTGDQVIVSVSPDGRAWVITRFHSNDRGRKS